MHFLLNILSTGAIVFLIGKFLPSVHIKNFKTALIVAVVYSLLNYFLGWIFGFLTFPLMLVTLGLFKFVINAFFLWVTDKLINDFKIDGLGWTLVTAFLISAGSTLIGKIF